MPPRRRGASIVPLLHSLCVYKSSFSADYSQKTRNRSISRHPSNHYHILSIFLIYLLIIILGGFYWKFLRHLQFQIHTAFFLYIYIFLHCSSSLQEWTVSKVEVIHHFLFEIKEILKLSNLGCVNVRISHCFCFCVAHRPQFFWLVRYIIYMFDYWCHL